MTCLKPIICRPLQTSSAGHASKVEAFGNNISKLKGASDSSTTQNHNSFVDALSYWLGARARIPLQGGKYGRPCTCKGVFSGLIGLLQQALRGSIGGPGFEGRAAIRTMIDIKT